MRHLLLALLAAGCSFEPPGQCQTSDQCVAGSVCKGGICTACAADEECSPWQRCGSTLRCTTIAGRCGSATDCPVGNACDATYTCVPSDTATSGVGGSAGGTGGGGGGATGPGGTGACIPTGSEDVVSATGTAGGQSVSMLIHGGSNSTASSTGFIEDTSGTNSNSSPAGTVDVFIQTNHSQGAKTGFVYQTSNASGAPNLLSVYVSGRGVSSSCLGSATGTVSYVVYQLPGTGKASTGITGTYTYNCPSQNISLTGCFRYQYP